MVDLDQIKPKNLDDVETYGEGEDEDEDEEKVKEDTEMVEEEAATPATNVSELDIVKAKLAKIRKVNKLDMNRRKEAVNRNSARV